MKLVRLAIFLTGIMGLAMGGVTAVSSLKTNQEEALLKTHENLKTEAAQYVDQLFGALEGAKTWATSNGASPGYITHQAVLKLKDNSPAEFENFNTLDSQATQMDLALEERVLSALKSDLSMGDLSIMKVAYGTFKASDISAKEGIFVATPIHPVTNGVVNPAVIEKVNVVLVDPSRALSNLSKISANDQVAYLFDKHGRVLAHTLPAFVGADLKKVHGLKDTIENLFLGAQTGSVGKYTNVEGTKQIVAVVRAGTSPFAIAIEQKAPPAVLSGAWISDAMGSGAARKNFAVMLMMVAIAFMSFAGISIFATKELQKQIDLNKDAREADKMTIDAPAIAPTSKVAPSLMNPNPATSLRGIARVARQEAAETQAPGQAQAEIQIPTSIAKAAENFVEIRGELNAANVNAKTATAAIQKKREDVDGFIAAIKKSYTMEGIEQALTEISSELSDSPVLYFRYHRRNQALNLTSVTGEVKIPNHADMQAYVRKDIELQVEQLAEQGKVSSLTNYGPINKLIIANLNVAHFEAWGVTSSSEVSGQAKLVGVLVILQAGIKSAQSRPAIARALRESGNYLHAIGNKVKSRNTIYANSNPNSTVDTINL